MILKIAGLLFILLLIIGFLIFYYSIKTAPMYSDDYDI